MRIALFICAALVPVLAVAPTYAKVAASVLPAAAKKLTAGDAPKLPASSKKLTGKDIAALYQGATMKWTNFSMKTGAMGTVTFDLAHGKQTGTWEMDGKKGDFKGTAKVKGDTLCYKAGDNPQECDFVYVDGKDIYEVNKKGIVVSQLAKV